ncbi:TetR/AcrR family transcriptional regulator [Glycomyces tarimensis]
MPSSGETAADRRALLKERHRRAIIDAAAALMEETGGTEFTVVQLAERADVSRRTVFNHFATVDDIVITVCGELLGAIVDGLELGSARSDSPFDEVADVLSSADLVEPMAYLTRVLGGPDAGQTPRSAVILLRSFTQVSEGLSAKILQRHPDTDELTAHLLVSALVSGLITIHRHWHAQTGAAVDAHSHRVWQRLLERLLDATRRGYGSM